ncbi:MAG: hypothetical protein O2924_01535 [Chloroflexi bacterium]|nr:hypothetical protein [Chloroflexota bacterium]MQC25611.1 hypothetical protein [Chloroflexota bacterium]MQC47706.1 hypothetical protein [Chloroflexota bacterium]
MKVIGRDIGGVLDSLHGELDRRVVAEAERPLQIEAFEGGSFSNIEWRDDTVVVQLHKGVPTHALPHVLGVALQHIRQRLDLYPRVIAPVRQIQGGPLLRSALRELVMGPEAEMHLMPFNLDMEWEVEQRHQGLKDLLRDATPEWDAPSTVAFTFAALQYGRFTLEHPEQLWGPLRDQFQEKLPRAAERGAEVVVAVQKSGWKTPGACLESLVSARDLLGLQEFAAIEDRQRGRLM